MSEACSYEWCGENCNGRDHSSGGVYVPAILSAIHDDDMGVNGLNGKTIGVGVRYNSVDGLPAIFVHIVGGSDDGDAELDWHAALDLSVALDEAISLLHEVLRGGVDLKPKPWKRGLRNG